MHSTTTMCSKGRVCIGSATCRKEIDPSALTTKVMLAVAEAMSNSGASVCALVARVDVCERFQPTLLCLER